LLSSALSLPELVTIAEHFTAGKIHLSLAERDFLLLLLQSYAQDILDNGQRIQLGPVTMLKNTQGFAFVHMVN
jgi:hypothetical protein